ncbi:MAG TPA: lipocalin family protein [Cytophagaceae bacterium]|nr:lipocalin family protein [Cytophagaceae bacterium]
MNKKILIRLKRSKFFKLRFTLFFGFVILSLMVSSVYFTYNIPKRTSSDNVNLNNIYNTWKIVKYYKNGKLVVNSKKFQNLRFRVNADGTADWIKEGNESNFPFTITKDGTQLIANNGGSIENVETIYELTENRLRFGKRNILSHYEYVMVPYDFVMN